MQGKSYGRVRIRFLRDAKEAMAFANLQRRPPWHEPQERNAPMMAWQADCKDVSSVAASPDGKQQQVVETFAHL